MLAFDGAADTDEAEGGARYSAMRRSTASPSGGGASVQKSSARRAHSPRNVADEVADGEDEEEEEEYVEARMCSQRSTA